MKILQINVFHYRKGGSEIVYLNTSRLLREHGHEVVNFALKWKDNIDSPYSSYFPESKETRTGFLRPIKNVLTYFYHPAAARRLKALIKAEKPDIAQVHLIWGQLTPSILRVLKRYGIPTILTAHDYRIICPAYVCRNGHGEVCEQCQGKKFYKCISNTCYKGSKWLSAMMAAEQYMRNTLFNPARLVSGIIYVSDFSRRMHEKYMPALKKLHSVKIYNFTMPVKSYGDKEQRYYLYFGRLSTEKGILTLLKAAASLPELKFKIVGTGPMQNELLEFVHKNNIKNVDFLGYMTGDKLSTVVRNAYFVIVPSECYENNPMTVIEAYSAGTPVIGARIGGIPEIIEEGSTGMQFTAGDSDDLVNVIDRAENLNPQQYEHMQRQAVEYAEHNFSPDVYYSRLINFYSSLI